jgi:hypothetical protein
MGFSQTCGFHPGKNRRSGKAPAPALRQPAAAVEEKVKLTSALTPTLPTAGPRHTAVLRATPGYCAVNGPLRANVWRRYGEDSAKKIALISLFILSCFSVKTVCFQ